jgi:hypothetical protein
MGGRNAAAKPENAASAQRESLADQRESLADQRESEADQRESLADQRELKLDQLELELAEHGRALGVTVATMQQQTLEAIERSRVVLALSSERVERAKAAVKRAEACLERQEAEIGRASAESERNLAALLPDPSELADRVVALRKQALAAIEAFAVTEEEVARTHEDLATRNPERRDEFHRTAEQARTTAGKAREMLRILTD